MVYKHHHETPQDCYYRPEDCSHFKFLVHQQQEWTAALPTFQFLFPTDYQFCAVNIGNTERVCRDKAMLRWDSCSLPEQRKRGLQVPQVKEWAPEGLFSDYIED